MDDKIDDISRRTFLATGATLVAASSVDLTTKTAYAAELTSISVSTIADALNRVGHDSMKLSMSPDIKPLTSIDGTIIGPAVTTQWQFSNERMTPDDVRQHMFEPLDEADAGSIWVVAGSSEQMLSLFGGVIGIACKRNGLAGTVTDNACRDITTFEDADFPVFGKTTVPYGPGTFARPVAANVPLICGGAAVNPGDYVAADRDGVIVIPRETYANVMEAATDILAKEQQVVDKIADGMSLAEAYTL